MARGTVPILRVEWHDGRDVGTLVVPGAVNFAYGESWLHGGYDLSPLSVPFAATLFQLSDPSFDSLPGFLADCLPDQWGRRLMERDFAAQRIDPSPLRMLAWVGRRGLGALRFAPAMDDGVPHASWAPVTPLLLTREAQAVLRREPPEAFTHLRRAGTAGGAFPKATVALLTDGSVLCGGDVAAEAPSHPGARLGLLKLDCEDDPLRPSTDARMELAYLQMAQAAGLRVARAEILRHDDAERARHHLFVERFDVVGGRRLHLVSLAGLLHRFALTYDDLLAATRRLTADRREVLEAARRMIFNVRAANADDHGKNHSFLFDERIGAWKLSPAYDLTLNFSEERSFGGLSPSTFGPSPQRSALEDVAVGAGMTVEEFATFDQQIAAAIDRWAEFAAAVQLSRSETERARQAHQRMASALSAGRSSAPRRRRRRW
jgi:serine/threonine-protein kinase HipA